MELDEAKKLSLELIETTKTVILSTIDSKGYPITRALTNVRNKERYPQLVSFFRKQKNRFTIIFSTNTSSSKIEHIKKNPKNCVYFCDPDDFRGLLLRGDLQIVNDLDTKKEFFLETSIKFYPKGVEDPDYTILRLEPKNAKLYYKLKETNFKLCE
ncbi:MAG: pyridoxamine 5'-phosphate oxidase family protein [Promethearchaeota archaeon]